MPTDDTLTQRLGRELALTTIRKAVDDGMVKFIRAFPEYARLGPQPSSDIAAEVWLLVQRVLAALPAEAPPTCATCRYDSWHPVCGAVIGRGPNNGESGFGCTLHEPRPLPTPPEDTDA